MPSKTRLILPWTLIAGLVAAAGSLSPGVSPSPANPVRSEAIAHTDPNASRAEHPATLASFGETIDSDRETNRLRREPQAPASVAIFGPAETEPGDLVILEARGEYEGIRWILGNSPKSFLPVDEGRRCVFSSGAPGEYRFFAVVAQRDGDRTTLADASFVVKVGGPAPTPVPPAPTPIPTPTPVPPAPEPTPPPAPPTPTDPFDAAIDRAVKSVEATSAERKAVGANYRRVHEAIERASEAVVDSSSEVIATEANAFKRLRELNQQSLGARWSAWQPAIRAIDAACQSEVERTTDPTVFTVGNIMARVAKALGE